jgi:hypothetical protein
MTTQPIPVIPAKARSAASRDLAAGRGDCSKIPCLRRTASRCTAHEMTGARFMAQTQKLIGISLEGSVG